MESYTLPDKASYRDIEEAICMVQSYPGIGITLPNILQYKGSLGIEGLMCQLVATWMRVNPDRRVYIAHDAISSEDHFKDLCASLYGTCVLQYATDIQLLDGSAVNRHVALESAYRSVRDVSLGRYDNAYNGSYVTVFSFKSLGSNKEYNNRMYLGQDALDRGYVRSVVREIIQTVVNDDEYSLISEFVDSASEIVSELYDNTHNHSRYSVDGVLLSENFRAIVIDCSEMNAERLQELSQDGVKGMLGIYSDWTGWMIANGRNIPILNITVVDSGPGYARRWTSKEASELTWDEESQAIEKCFTKNYTTTRNYASGSGLSHVMRDVKKLKGILTLRTGRALVSKGFHNGQGSIKVLKEDMVEKKVFVEGVSFNISVPLVNMGGGNV